MTETVSSQQVIPIPIKMKAGGFHFDSTSFNIFKVIDQRANQQEIGTVYGGILNLGFTTVVKRGVEKTYSKFFYKGLKNTKTGDKQLVIAFRDLVYTHDNLEAKKRKEIRLEIAIDYYENKDGKLSFIFTDKNSKIINEKFYQKQLSKYSYDFFKKSLNKVDAKIKSEINEEIGTPFTPALIDNSNTDTIAAQADVAHNGPTDQLQSLDSLPEQNTRPKSHHLVTFESFKGSNAYGYRLRYVGFARDWNYFNWKGALSVDIEVFSLNKEVPGANVYYSYFALVVGAVKPFNNYLFLDLNAKIAIWSEIIDLGIFVEQERNTFIGLLLNQRIHLILGEGFGVVLTAGMYENFFGGAQFINADLCFLVGGGIKF